MVFIDGDNTNISVRNNLHTTIEYKNLKNYFEHLKGFQGISFCVPFLYGKEQNDFRDYLYKGLNFRIIGRTPKKIWNEALKRVELKTDMDTWLVVDMLKNIHLYKTAILFSGDSDFEPVVKYLCEQDKIVIVVSTRKSMSKELQKIVGIRYCFYIENLKGVI